MTRPAKMLRELLGSIFKKAATTKYPRFDKKMPSGFRGKIRSMPEKCIGCLMCVKDCPTGAIKITKTADKQFECEIDLAKCIYCGQCVDSCPKKALEISDEFELAQLKSDKLKIIYKPKPQSKE